MLRDLARTASTLLIWELHFHYKQNSGVVTSGRLLSTMRHQRGALRLLNLQPYQCICIAITARRQCSIELFASYLGIYLYTHLATVCSLNSTYYSQYCKNFCVRQCPFFIPLLSVGETMGTAWKNICGR